MQAILFQQFSSSMANTVIFCQGTTSQKQPCLHICKSKYGAEPIACTVVFLEQEGSVC